MNVRLRLCQLQRHVFYGGAVVDVVLLTKFFEIGSF